MCPAPTPTSQALQSVHQPSLPRTPLGHNFPPSEVEFRASLHWVLFNHMPHSLSPCCIAGYKCLLLSCPAHCTPHGQGKIPSLSRPPPPTCPRNIFPPRRGTLCLLSGLCLGPGGPGMGVDPLTMSVLLPFPFPHLHESPCCYRTFQSSASENVPHWNAIFFRVTQLPLSTHTHTHLIDRHMHMLTSTRTSTFAQRQSHTETQQALLIPLPCFTFLLPYW